MLRGRQKDTTGADVILATERRAQALQMRLEHKSYEQIAAALGCARSTACKYVMDELEKRKAECGEKADKVRDMERQRLDMCADALKPKVALGDPRSIETYLRVCERRAKLLGLDAPQKVAWTDGDGNDKPIGVVLMPVAEEVKPE